MLTASAMPDRLRFALDGNLDTKWLSAAPQSGSEWLRVEFGRDVDVGRVAILTSRFGVGDYPRALLVESETGMDPGWPVFRLVPPSARRRPVTRGGRGSGGSGSAVQPHQSPLDSADRPLQDLAVGRPRAHGVRAPTLSLRRRHDAGAGWGLQTSQSRAIFDRFFGR